MELSNDLHQRIRNYVIFSFEGNFRESGEPYSNHCLEVGKVAHGLCFNSDIVFLIASFHDIIEDDILSFDKLGRVLDSIGIRKGLHPRIRRDLKLLTKDRGRNFTSYIAEFPFRDRRGNIIENFSQIHLSHERKVEKLQTAVIKLADTFSNTNPNDVFDLELALSQFIYHRELGGSIYQAFLQRKLKPRNNFYELLSNITEEKFLDRASEVFERKLQRNSKDNLTSTLPILENMLCKLPGMDQGKYNREQSINRANLAYDLIGVENLIDKIALNSYDILVQRGDWTQGQFFDILLNSGEHRGGNGNGYKTFVERNFD